MCMAANCTNQSEMRIEQLHCLYTFINTSCLIRVIGLIQTTAVTSIAWPHSAKLCFRMCDTPEHQPFDHDNF